jgi:hypothetical protein
MLTFWHFVEQGSSAQNLFAQKKIECLVFIILNFFFLEKVSKTKHLILAFG